MDVMIVAGITAYIAIGASLSAWILHAAYRRKPAEPGSDPRAALRRRTGLTCLALSVVLTLSARYAILNGGVYGVAVFAGTPFTGGLAATLLLGREAEARLWTALKATYLVAYLTGTLFLLMGVDGLMCVVFAFPPAAFMAGLGALAGVALLRFGLGLRGSRAVSALSFPVLWALLALDASHEAEVDLRAVSTELEIRGDARAVWDNVVAFPPIDTPLTPLFRLGIAHPLSAHIEGEGVGAVRTCRFDTGDFVEPITVWEPERRLAFDVTDQPLPLTETSPYPDLDVPHLHDSFASERGEFLLTPTGEGTVILRGTTWYRQHLWPHAYWDLVSDQIVHRIHLRVLEHIRTCVEGSAPESTH